MDMVLFRKWTEEGWFALQVDENISMDNLNQLLDWHRPFIIRTVSNYTGRYISVENDEEYSIALSAFAEAVERFNPEKGKFLSYVKLVIESRLTSHFRKKNREPQSVSLDALYESGMDFTDYNPAISEEQDNITEEIEIFKSDLALFGMTLDSLADTAPKHRDTRQMSFVIAETTSRDTPTVELTYRKRNLPIRQVARLASVTEKIVKGNKHYITGVLIVFVRRLNYFIDWIRGGR